jgi:peptidoglycan/LPS O-acetylase OafA/YrhL
MDDRHGQFDSGSHASPPKLAYIDAVRGVAILGVMALHCAQAVPASSTVLQYAMLIGVRGVQLFYLASAITLCMSWNRRSVRELCPTRNYFLRRFWRIAPLFYLAIGGYLLLDGWEPREWAPNGVRGWFVPVTFMMAHGWHPETINAIVPGSWSIAVEFTFYLILPIILSLVTTAGRATSLLAIAMGICIANIWLMPQVWAPRYPENEQYLVDAFTFFNFFSQLPVFAIGVTAYFAIRNRSYRGVVASVVLGVCTSVASIWLRGSELTVPSILKHHVVFSAVLSVIVVFLSMHPVAVVVNPVTLFFGKLSYGLYLIHFAVIHYLTCAFAAQVGERGDVQSVSFFLLAASVSVLLALMANRLVEEPGIALGKRIVAWGESREAKRRRVYSC